MTNQANQQPSYANIQAYAARRTFTVSIDALAQELQFCLERLQQPDISEAQRANQTYNLSNLFEDIRRRFACHDFQDLQDVCLRLEQNQQQLRRLNPAEIGERLYHTYLQQGQQAQAQLDKCLQRVELMLSSAEQALDRSLTLVS